MVALAFGCSSPSRTTHSEAGIYAAVIRATVPPENGEGDDVTREIFVWREPAVPLELQASILQELDEYERVRFIDDPEEAIEADAPMAVRNDGVYLEFTALQATQQEAHVDVLRYFDEARQDELVVVLVRSGGAWSVDTITDAP